MTSILHLRTFRGVHYIDCKLHGHSEKIAKKNIVYSVQSEARLLIEYKPANMRISVTWCAASAIGHRVADQRRNLSGRVTKYPTGAMVGCPKRIRLLVVLSVPQSAYSVGTEPICLQSVTQGSNLLLDRHDRSGITIP